MKKNIIWVHSHFLFWMGGTKFIYEVAKEINSRKSGSKKLNQSTYNLVVVVEDVSDLAKKQYQELGVELISLDSWTSTNPLYWLFLPWFIHRRAQQLSHLLQQRKFKNSETTLISSMFPMNAVANQLGLRHLQLCYEPFAFFYDQDFIKTFPWLKKLFIQLIAALYHNLDRHATKKADVVLTLNSVTQATIAETYQRESVLVYAGVDAQRFKPYVPEALKLKYHQRSVAIHSTDYSPVKGTDRVIKAMKLVVKQVPNSVLLITSTIKNPEAEAKLQAQAQRLGISNHVKFLGFLPILELPHYYSLAQVLVQGSNSAKSGTTSMALPVKEAMCCETPAIRPNLGGEDVVDGVTGFLVDPAETKILAQKMALLLSQPKLSKKMGKAARKSIADAYTWKKTTNRLLKHL